MTQEPIRIAIDGPAAAGKSTVAKLIAENLSFIYIDTGAMYRALTLEALNQNIDLSNESALLNLMKELKIELAQRDSDQIVTLNGKDITLDIRTQDVTNNVSYVATHPSIRAEMVNQQQALAQNLNVVMDGRDIGTHVLPDAEVKVFLIASVEERAQRRHNENLHKGFNSKLADIQEDIKARDLRDSNREVAPLIKANDAIEIDTTSLSIDDVVRRIIDEVQNVIQNR